MQAFIGKKAGQAVVSLCYKKYNTNTTNVCCIGAYIHHIDFVIFWESHGYGKHPIMDDYKSLI